MSNKPFCGECSFCIDGFCTVCQQTVLGHERCSLHRHTMTVEQIEKVLHTYQKWRRGGRGKQPHPYVVGVAIDGAIKSLRSYANCKCGEL